MTEQSFLAIIGMQWLIIALLILVSYRIIRDLSDKIALPLYREDSKRTVFVSPRAQAKAAEATPNLPEHEDLVDINEVSEDDLYAAAVRQGRE